MMTRITGQPWWSDRCEDIAFNSLPATVSPDHRGLHYITCANCIQLDNEKKGYQFDNRFPMLAYKLGIREYRCCTHNYGMGWPYYAEELWLATRDNGLCASLYAPSEVKAKVAEGAEITVTEETDYPFGDTVNFRVAVPDRQLRALLAHSPLGAANRPSKYNGQVMTVKAIPLSYATIHREWKRRRHGPTPTAHAPLRAHLAQEHGLPSPWTTAL
jgi:DUF1680 family protein